MMSIFKIASASVALALLLLLQGCGRKGPLFMQPVPPPVTGTAKEAAPASPPTTVPNPSETKK